MKFDIEKDLPITDVSQDILGRDKFAKNLSDAIIHYMENSNNQECLVIGLEGEWGSGKTSMINLLRKYLENKANTGLFNSWMNLSKDNLAKEFFNTLINTLSPKSSSSVILDHLKDYGKRIFNESEIELSAQIPGTETGIKVSKKFNFENNTLLDQKLELKESLVSSGSKWSIIFIDDIDRISSDEICLLFQFIKNIADFPKVIYVLAYDISVVVEALNKVQNDRGEEYLKKVIQISYVIPEPDKDDLEEYFISGVNTITQGRESFRIDNEHFGDLFRTGITNYLKNLRDCKRLINTFSFKYSLCGSEVDIGDLAAVSALELFENPVYEAIKNNKFYMLGESYYGLLKPEPTQLKNFADRLLSLASESNKDCVKELLDNMFPGFWQRTGDGTVQSMHKIDNVRDKIRYEESFDKYFMLSIKSNEVPLEFIRSFINLNDREIMDNSLKYWNEHHMTYDAFRKLNSLADEIKSKHLKIAIDSDDFKHFLESLSRITLYNEIRMNLFSTYSLRDRLIKKLSLYTLSNPENNQFIFGKLSQFLTDKLISLSLRAILLQQTGQGKHWYFGEKDEFYRCKEQLISDEEFSRLRQIFLEQIKQEAPEENKFLSEENSKFLCLVWNREDPEGFSQFMKCGHSGFRLANRAQLFLANWTSNGMVSSYTWAINPDTFLNIKESLPKLKEYMITEDFKSKSLEWKERVAAFYLLKTKKDKNGQDIAEIENSMVKDFLAKS